LRSRILVIDPATYQPHAMHQGDRRWLETNCYVDVWIELLHALGHEPLACLGIALRTTLEADQWTFFKPLHGDMDLLYGVEVGELNVWSSLLQQTVNEVAAGHPIVVELDAWWLPDTRGTTYRAGHSKTSVAVIDIDPDLRRMGYFHNAGYFELEGEDFDEVFRLTDRYDASDLAPYAELVKPDAAPALRGRELRSAALDLLERNVARTPTTNPFTAYRPRFLADLAQLAEQDPDRFHAYAFAHCRQIGAAFELAAAHLAWLGAQDDHRPDVADLNPAAEQFSAIAATAKSLQMKAARRALAKRNVDPAADLDALESAWACGFRHLRTALG
jgi:hypothetical protein